MAFGDIVLLKDHTPHGPYTRAQIRKGLGRGDISGRELAHTPGMKDWLPLLEVLHHLDREPSPLPRPREARILPPIPSLPNAVTAPVIGRTSASASPPIQEAKPHTPPDRPAPPAEKAAPPPLGSGSPPFFPSHGTAVESSTARTVLPLPATPPRLQPAPLQAPPQKPAPLRRRFLACAIDGAVLFVPILLVFAFAYIVWLIKGPLEHRDPETARQEQALLWRNLRELLLMVAIGFAWIYAAGLESSRWQGTVGKQCLGLIVTDSQGERLSFLRATGRHAAKYLSALPLFLGFMAAFFNSQRLTWHDRLAGTRVVER